MQERLAAETSRGGEAAGRAGRARLACGDAHARASARRGQPGGAEEPPGVRGRPGAVHQVHVLLAEGDLIHDVPGDRRPRRPRRMGRARAARPRAGGRHLRPRGQRSPAAAGADRRRARGAAADRRRRHRPRRARARDGRARRHQRDPPRGAAGAVRARRPGARLAGERDRHGQRARGGAAARRRHGPGRVRVLDRGAEGRRRVPEHALRRLQARQRGHRGGLLRRLRRAVRRPAPAHRSTAPAATRG